MTAKFEVNLQMTHNPPKKKPQIQGDLCSSWNQGQGFCKQPAVSEVVLSIWFWNQGFTFRKSYELPQIFI